MSDTPPVPPRPGQPIPAPGLAMAMGDPAQVPGTKAYVEARFGRQVTFVERILPSLLDSLLTLPVVLVPVLLGTWLVVAGSPDQVSCGSYDGTCTVPGTGNGALVALGVLAMLLSVVLALAFELWNQAYRVSRTGQSLGRKICGLQVVNARTGELPTFGQALLKALVAGFAGLISAVWMLFDDEGRTLSDKVADAAVLRTR